MPTPEKLRKEYERVIGKSPDGRCGSVRLTHEIAKAEAQRGPPGAAGPIGKTGGRGKQGKDGKYLEHFKSKPSAKQKWGVVLIMLVALEVAVSRVMAQPPCRHPGPCDGCPCGPCGCRHCPCGGRPPPPPPFVPPPGAPTYKCYTCGTGTVNYAFLGRCKPPQDNCTATSHKNQGCYSDNCSNPVGCICSVLPTGVLCPSSVPANFTCYKDGPSFVAAVKSPIAQMVVAHHHNNVGLALICPAATPCTISNTVLVVKATVIMENVLIQNNSCNYYFQTPMCDGGLLQITTGGSVTGTNITFRNGEARCAAGLPLPS